MGIVILTVVAVKTNRLLMTYEYVTAELKPFSLNHPKSTRFFRVIQADF